MKLVSDETVLLESDTKELVLTTHRIRFQTKKSGRATVISIMLEELCSCGITHTSYPFLVVLAAIFFIGGIALGSLLDEASWAIASGIILGVLFIIVYFVTRKGVFSLASGGATINTSPSGMSYDNMVKFIDDVEVAKNGRLLYLNAG